MLTFQDLQLVGDSDIKRMQFVYQAIEEHKTSKAYRIAEVAEEYYRHQNRTIIQHENMLTTVTGKLVPDQWSANHKSISNFFFTLVTMQNQYLLGNGVKWTGKTYSVEEGTHGAVRKWIWDTKPTGDDASKISGHYDWQVNLDSGVKEKLGDDFDNRLIELGEAALVHGVSFAYYNKDHVEVYKLLNFVPLYDEENYSLRAGIYFFRIDGTKPMRATLYEADGYTEYIWNKRDKDGNYTSEGQIYVPKRPYVDIYKGTKADGMEYYGGRNYDGFPIIPLWGNKMKQSEFVGMQDGIDAYDFIKNGFENDLDNAQLYWIIKGAGGDDNAELARILDRLKVNKVMTVDDGQDVQPVTVDIPFTARETLLNRIRFDLIADFMSFDISNTAASTDTATGIKAMYTAIDLKCDLYESCVTDFILQLLELVGIKDKPTYKRNQNINKTEEIANLLALANYVDGEYITRAGLTILGDADAADEVLRRMENENLQRMSGIGLNLPMISETDNGENNETVD